MAASKRSHSHTARLESLWKEMMIHGKLVVKWAVLKGDNTWVYYRRVLKYYRFLTTGSLNYFYHPQMENRH